jgi:hypothetical protein
MKMGKRTLTGIVQVSPEDLVGGYPRVSRDAGGASLVKLLTRERTGKDGCRRTLPIARMSSQVGEATSRNHGFGRARDGAILGAPLPDARSLPLLPLLSGVVKFAKSVKEAARLGTFNESGRVSLAGCRGASPCSRCRWRFLRALVNVFRAPSSRTRISGSEVVQIIGSSED